MAQAPTIESKFVDYITMSSAAMEKTAEEERARAEKTAEVAQLIPQTVQEMVAHERVRPDQAEKLAAMLGDHARTLEILAKVAGHRNNAESAEEQVRLGRPATHEKAAAVGGRRGDRTTASDAGLLAAFGIAPR